MTVREFIKLHPHDGTVSQRQYAVDLAVKYFTDTGKSTTWEYVRKKLREVEKSKPLSLTIKERNDARILIFDIETAPLKAHVWGKWKQNINDSHIIKDWFMLTWSAKWLFEDKVLSDRIKPKEVLKEDDRRITKSIWKLLDEANIIIAHNAVKFDVKRLNTRFLKHGLGHPSPYQVIDTLKHARKEFAITSNRLDYIAKFIGVEGKMETGGFELWEQCGKGNKEALKKMEAYNIKDVLVLEDVYLHLRPYMRSHPNIGLHIVDSAECCAACGSNDLTECGEYATMVNVYVAFRCGNCNSISRRRHSALSVNDKRHLTNSVPR